MPLTDNKVMDINIPGVSKQKFRINGDNNKILELDTSDANIITRLNKGYKRLMELVDRIKELSDAAEEEDSDDAFAKLSDKLEELDKKMRNEVDYIFDSNVSEVCLGNGSMYDPKDGKFKFEHIIQALGNLYAESFNDEFDKIKARVEKHTGKYTKKKA